MGVINPFCPISFGFIGFLGSIITRRSTLLGDQSNSEQRDGEFENLLIVKGNDDDECDELSEARINRFLEAQKLQYYKSIGLEPLVALQPQQSSMLEASKHGTGNAGTPDESTLNIATPSGGASLAEDWCDSVDTANAGCVYEGGLQEMDTNQLQSSTSSELHPALTPQIDASSIVEPID